MPRTFLHIGVPKTGTTFLQAVLWRQRDLALDQGVLLPLSGVADHHLACLDLLGRPDRVESPEQVSGSWQRVVDTVTRHPGDALVSHELFALATPDQAARAVTELAAGGREVHVILTVRDLARQLPSLWQETVKAARTWTLTEFLRETRAGATAGAQDLTQLQDYAALVARWSQMLPAERVHLVTVPPRSAPPALLWERFCSVVGLDPQAFALDVPHANDSLGAEQTELLRRVNLALAGRMAWPAPYMATVKRAFARGVLAPRPGSRITLPATELAWVTDYASRQVQLLGESGADVVGDLSELLITGGSPADPVGSEAQVVDEAVAAVAELLLASAETRAKHRARVDRLKRRLDALQPPLRDSAARRAGRLLRRRTTEGGGS